MGLYRCFEPPLVRPGQAIHRYSRAPLPICSRTGSTSTLCYRIATANPEFRPTFTVSPGACSSPTRRPSCSRTERPARRHSAGYISPRASPKTIATTVAASMGGWGTKVTAVEIKDIVLPDNMQRAMAKEAEAERERRAKIVAAEGEYQAAVKLGQAADIITQHPVALQLRTLQTMAEISVEKNSTIIFPAQFMTTVHEAIALLSKDSASK